MVVWIEVHGALREQVKKEEFQMDLPDGSRVVDAIAALGLADRVDLWVLLDGSKAGREAVLSEGCRFTFFQPVGGG
jgi:molybdopterin converting factor small subunit